MTLKKYKIELNVNGRRGKEGINVLLKYLSYHTNQWKSLQKIPEKIKMKKGVQWYLNRGKKRSGKTLQGCDSVLHFEG